MTFCATCLTPARGGTAGPRPTSRPAPAATRRGRRRFGGGGGGGAATHRRPTLSPPPGAPSALPAPSSADVPPTAGDGFHVSRMRAAPPGTPKPPPLPGLALRVATTDAELAAAAALRAHAFYVYPPERAFAGRLHQDLKAREEFEALVAVRDANNAAAAAAAAGAAAASPPSRSACIIAVAPLSAFGPPPPPAAAAAAHPDPYDPDYPHPALHLDTDTPTPTAVVGTLDVAYARAVPGEDLVGDCATSAAYMANVCAAPPARRRGVGARLLAAARGAARGWGVDALYVHALAVNEVAARFYGGAGFGVEKAEAPSAAKARGHCLDGVEGLGRAVLWRDGRLRDPGVEVEAVAGL